MSPRANAIEYQKHAKSVHDRIKFDAKITSVQRH
jgi:hypothetical protein